jgi:hypothetical protein
MPSDFVSRYRDLSRTLVPHSNLFETIGTIFAEFPPRRRANGFAAGSSRVDVL